MKMVFVKKNQKKNPPLGGLLFLGRLIKICKEHQNQQKESPK